VVRTDRKLTELRVGVRRDENAPSLASFQQAQMFDLSGASGNAQ
jgi:hypothetical protein